MSGATSSVQAQVEKAHREVGWYQDLLRKQEALAKENPKRYASRIRWFAALAYGYIFFMLALCLAVVAGTIWLMVAGVRGGFLEIKLIVICLVVVWGIVTSLFVKIEMPEGLVIERAKAPGLYGIIDALADRAGAPKIDEIRVTTDFNASAAQFPRLGIFGYYKNILFLGMPMMLTLSPEEMRAVIAHEFGHFSGEHGKVGAWAYRVNQTWEQLHENLHRRGSRGAWLFRWFFNWYAPRFEATSFALRRANEYEADAAAASVVGAPTVARMLMKLEMLERHLDLAFWKPYSANTKTLATPPTGAFQAMVTVAASPLDLQDARETLDRSLRKSTSYDDVHPSLTDRLKALGQAPALATETLAEDLKKPTDESAAQALLGTLFPTVLRDLESWHIGEIRDGWQARHQEYSEMMGRLTALDETAATRELTVDESLERAHLTYLLCENDVAIPVLRATQEHFPESAPANFLLGQALLDEIDASGLPWLQKAVELDGSYSEVVRRVRYSYFVSIGDEQTAELLRKEAFEASVRTEVETKEAEKVSLKITYDSPAISAEMRERLSGELRKVDRLEAAYLVSRTMPASGTVFHLLVLFRKKSFIESGNESQEFIQRVARSIDGPERSSVCAPEPRKKWIAKLDKVPGAKLL